MKSASITSGLASKMMLAACGLAASLLSAGCAMEGAEESEEAESVDTQTQAMCPVDDPDCLNLRLRCFKDNDHDGFGGTTSTYVTTGVCPAGYSPEGGDCNDASALVHETMQCWTDADGDGYGTGSPQIICATSCPAGKAARAGDCSDSDAAKHWVSCYRDADGDGRTGTAIGACASSCSAAGYTTINDDCNDSNTAIPRKCAIDDDGDGYTALKWYCSSTCPSTAGKFGDHDCNDSAAAVHPEQAEAPNGKDDNCDDKVDEAEYVYGSAGYNSTAISLEVPIKLNDSTVRDLALAGNLFAKIHYRHLDNYADEKTTAILSPVTTSETSDGGAFVSFRVTMLAPQKIYRAQAEFFTRTSSKMFASVSSPMTTRNYLTMTDSLTSDDLEQVRTRIVLNALFQWDESERGLIKNGSRFNTDSKWCSEFYAWITGAWLKDMGAGGLWGMNTSGALIDYFDGYSEYHPGFSSPVARPGDYLPVDTNNDLSNSEHSEMFLAYDPADPNQVWIVNGNDGNRVKVRQESTSVIVGIGHITSAMLK